MEWLKLHVFVAAWFSPIIALIGLLVKRTPSGEMPVDWSRLVIYVGWLTCLAVLVTPGVEPFARGTFEAMAAMGFGFLIFDVKRR